MKIKAFRISLLVLLSILLPSEKVWPHGCSPARFFCVVAIPVVKPIAKKKQQPIQKGNTAQAKHKKQHKKLLAKRTRRLTIATLFGGVLGLFFRKKSKQLQKRIKATNGNGGGGIVLTVLLLGALIWFFIATGMPIKTILLLLGIAILILGLIIGIIHLAVRNL